jgi:hypothetical protein
MTEETSKPCVECEGSMSPIIIMDRYHGAHEGHSQALRYRQPDDHLSFWTGKYPSAGVVRAFLCGDCGRIALYGGKTDA